ncbi:unnamed protein product, partial [Pylaiella littoralis]
RCCRPNRNIREVEDSSTSCPLHHPCFPPPAACFLPLSWTPPCFFDTNDFPGTGFPLPPLPTALFPLSLAPAV